MKGQIAPSVFKSAMDSATKSFWGVNILKSGLFGRSLREEDIALQAEVARRIPMTRVFVLENDDTQETRLHLRKVIAAQLAAGLILYVITRQQFESAKGAVADVFETDDFVVIDNMVYTSEPGGKKFMWTEELALQLAYKFAKRIQLAASAIESAGQVDELVPVG